MSTLIGTTLLFRETYTVGSQSGFAFTTLHLLFYWVTLLTMLGYGKKYLNRKSTFMTYFNPAAFPVYIFHQNLFGSSGGRSEFVETAETKIPDFMPIG
ncbi:hypothetical protein [Paenibacillus baimaensis]|uniref:hypothetical protein n=1 Tax=Paenibacillus baimaensis TaxID=2982185 RepID=UPI0021D35321|nr:hypothetical protein [Paenibacillus sp. WQ 127069]